MSDIDMQSYGSSTGAQSGSAAANPQQYNSYLEETSYDDVPVYPEFLNPPQEEPVEAQKPQVVEEKAPSAQEMNFRALREEMERKQAKIEELERNYESIRFQQQSLQNSKQQEISAPKRPFDLDKSEIPNVGEIENAWARQEQTYAQREVALKEQMEEILVAQKYPDYAEVLEKYTSTLLKQKPHLAEGIRGASNKALYAYELGKLAQQQSAPEAPQVAAAPQVNPNAQRMVDNARKPRSMGQAGGQGALSQADYFANMSDKQFMEYASRHLD